MFPRFETVEQVDPELLAQLERIPGFPPELLAAWREHGAGFVNPEGLVRLIDPSELGAQLPDWFDDTTGAIPFATTGLGDIFVWQEGVVRWIAYRTGHIQAIEATAGALMEVWENPRYLDELLYRERYLEGVARLGRPELDEAFFYAPFLLAGGVDDAAHLDRGTLAVTLTIFSQLMGKASLKG